MTLSFRISLQLVGVATAIASGEHSVDNGKALIDWLQSKGGSFSSKAAIRSGDPNDFASSGVFATEKIKKGETIVHIPASCLLVTRPLKVGDKVIADDDNSNRWYDGKIVKNNMDGSFDILYDDGDMTEGVSPTMIDREESVKVCEMTKALSKEMSLGDNSEYLPYINYHTTHGNGQLPFGWSEAGRVLLNEVIEDLNPMNMVSHTWKGLCSGTEKDDIAAPNEDSFLMAHKSWGEIMVPFLDIMQHRNGEWLNTITSPIQAGKDLYILASKDIEAGREIYHTRNLCDNCADRKFSGTTDLLRDFGFIEKYPQRWMFTDLGAGFEIDEEIDENDTISSELKVSWIEGSPTKEVLDFLAEQLVRLEKLEVTILKSPDESIPKIELDLINQYHKSALIAIGRATEMAQQLAAKNKTQYDNLEAKENDIDYLRHGDDSFSNLTVIDNRMSAYQEIEYYTFNSEPEIQDMCFSLDTTNQQCLSYRPHYHEYMVHYAARYLDSVKRVVFVGGGDSLLLHESLKYPTIELVVGLEIDQKVTRSSFKHFGAQPHWDDDRVEWWFGDAAKSLLMLPKDYFGSFDLVLVDLSETIMSLTVSDHLDIMDALGLLLKEDGIFLKNEMYLEAFSEIWEYSALLHFYHVPIVISQAIVLGSNKVDFLHRTPKDHDGVENLLVKPLNEIQGNFEHFHDYVQGDIKELKHCKGEDDDEEAEEQENSPGILMILEAENASLTYDSSQQVQKAISNALEKEGFTVKSTIDPKNGADGIIVAGVILEEGFVVARGWPSDKYFAFDVHLWSSFEKHSSAKEALIEAVGSSGGKSSSSYRIVAGGMFGVTSWRDDEKNRGPRFTRDCERPEGVVREGVMSNSALNTILQDSMALIKDDNIIVSVVCGYEEDECKSIDSMKTTEIVSNVVPIWTCPGLKSKQTGKGDLSACEKVLLDTLLESSKEEKVRAIVIDPSAPFEMGQIILNIFKSKSNRIKILTDDIMVLAPVLEISENWRRNLVDRFRQEIVFTEPVYLADVVFNSSDSTMELAMTSSGDVDFFQNLNEAMVSIEKRSEVVSDVRSILGGQFVRPPPGSQVNFTHDSYDHVSSFEQWNSQKPVGLQTLFQFEVRGIIGLGDKVMVRDMNDAEMYQGVVSAVDVDGKFTIQYDDGDVDTAMDRDSLFKVGLVTDSDKVSGAEIKEAWIKILGSIESISAAISDIHEFNDVGLGFLLVAFWPGGTANLLWDGKNHIDLNIFTFSHNEELHAELKTLFIGELPSLKTVLHDEQPRGFGRVVSYAKDLEDPTPTWVELMKSK